MSLLFQYETILKFSTDPNLQELEGGQDESLKVGQLVLKPVHEEKEYVWVSATLENLDFSSLNISKPICSLNGKYIEDGIGATPYFENIGHVYDVIINLRLCRQLNEILKTVLEPVVLFEELNNPWKKAQFLAWHGKSNPDLPSEILFLISLRKNIDLPKQLIHVDLAGNVLINEHNETCIIDFTPAFLPKEYAEAVVIVDSISWYQASIGALNELKLEKSISYQLLLRALIFRMSVPLFLNSSENNENHFYEKLSPFKKVYAYFENNHIE